VKGLREAIRAAILTRASGTPTKSLPRFLYGIMNKKYGMVLSEIGGGNLHNAIAREA
jgi:dipeptidase D